LTITKKVSFSVLFLNLEIVTIIARGWRIHLFRPQCCIMYYTVLAKIHLQETCNFISILIFTFQHHHLFSLYNATFFVLTGHHQLCTMLEPAALLSRSSAFHFDILKYFILGYFYIVMPLILYLYVWCMFCWCVVSQNSYTAQKDKASTSFNPTSYTPDDGQLGQHM
jgi:hypothetical protein